MDKEHIKKLAQDPKFISGIYNYCDRWCERCPYTSRCMNYEISEERFSDPESRDMNNGKFWDKLRETFEVTKEMIYELAEEKGIDLNSEDMKEVQDELDRQHERARNHVLAKDSYAYTDMVNKWFEAGENLFKEKEKELNDKLHLSYPGSHPRAEAVGIADAVDIIRWYQYQIHVKLVRALEGRERGHEDTFEDYPKDSDGSAKVALIGMDRSIGAWEIMRKHFPEEEEAILNMLIQLDRVRKFTEKTFPDARAFIRPGFDDKIDLLKKIKKTV